MAPALSLAPLDGVRALCCLVIITGHLFMYMVPRAADGGAYPLVGVEFHSAVSMFMVLSGFTLTVVYGGSARQAEALRRPAGVRTFLWRRFVRLAPLYYASLLVALPWLLCYSTATNIAVSVPVALLLLQSLSGPVGGYWNGPLWQISALALSYLAFPALLARMQRLDAPRLRRLLRWLAAGGLLLPLVVIGVVFGAGGGFAGATYMHTFGGLRMLQFAMGMAGGLLALGPAASAAAGGGSELPALALTGAGDEHGAALQPAPAPAAGAGTDATRLLNVLSGVLAGCSLAVLAVVTAMPDGDLRFYAWMSLMYLCEYTLPAVQVHWLMALTAAPRGSAIAAALQLPPVRWLGDASYAIFCLHWPVVMLCGWALAGRGISADAMPLVRRAGGAVEGWFAFPAWAVPLLIAICVAVGGLAEWLNGRLAGAAGRDRKARKAALLAGAPADAVTAAHGGGGGHEAGSTLLGGAGASAVLAPAAAARI